MTQDSTGQKGNRVRARKPALSAPSRRQQKRKAKLAKWWCWNWTKQNAELVPGSVLERIWKLTFNAAANYRWREHLAAPKWALSGGPTALSRRGERRTCHRVVRAEEWKAAKYFAERDRFLNVPRDRCFCQRREWLPRSAVSTGQPTRSAAGL